MLVQSHNILIFFSSWFRFSLSSFEARDPCYLHISLDFGSGDLFLHTVSVVGIKKEERWSILTIEEWIWNSAISMWWWLNER